MYANFEITLKYFLFEVIELFLEFLEYAKLFTSETHAFPLLHNKPSESKKP